ncbi:MAG: hypothetical protein HY291_19540 [Planctomycetes bacterium]|nr:hypothetical protein [Planctomycetota bacterium]
MSMRMTMLAASVMLGLGASALRAADDGAEVEVRKIAMPKGFPQLTDAEQKLLDEANAALLASYAAMRKNDTKTAIDELNRSMVLRNRIIESKNISKENTGKGYFSRQQGTAEDKVDREGGLERFLEIKKTGGQLGAADHDYELHKRKIIKNSEKDARELAEEQKELAAMLQMMAMNQPQQNGGGKQTKKQDAQLPQQQANSNGGGGQQQPQQNQNQNGQQPANNQNQNGQENKENQNGEQKNQNGQQQANAQNQNGEQKNQNQNGQQQANAQNQNGQQQNNNQNGEQQNQNQNGQQQANAQNQNGQQQGNPQDPQNQQGQAGAANRADQAANRQEQIAGQLNDIATKLDQMSKGRNDESGKAAEVFRQAAAGGEQTAEMIRKGDLQGAAAASRNTEQKIREALAAAGMANTTNLETALQNVENELKRLQGQQQKVADQAQRAGEGAGGQQADERVKNERTKGLAGEQAKLLGEIKGLQDQLNQLAQGTGAADPNQRTPENAARQELQGASRAMQGKRASQAATNAAVQLGQGDIQGAEKSMAQVQEALNSAREKVAAASNALVGEDRSAAERALRDLKGLTSALRRIEQTAKNAAGQNNANGQHGEGEPQQANGKQQAAGQGKETKTGEGKNEGGKQTANQGKNAGNSEKTQPGGEGKEGGENQAAQGDPKGDKQSESGGQGTVTATWGQVLNRSTKDAQSEAARMAGKLAKLSQNADAKKIEDLAKKEPEFERDFDGSMMQVRVLLAELEKVEVDLASQVNKEQEKRALKNIQKDNVPSEYRGAVAAYYEDLAKDGAKEEKK